jgi:hypothetical protein
MQQLCYNLDNSRVKVSLVVDNTFCSEVFCVLALRDKYLLEIGAIVYFTSEVAKQQATNNK